MQFLLRRYLVAALDEYLAIDLSQCLSRKTPHH